MKPFFINSPSGNIFALYHTPEEGTKVKRNILFIPPFGEELNRSRHMVNRQARAFTKAGYGVLILDLFGTGDSEGQCEQANISLWQQDIHAACVWLRKASDTAPLFWAMRSGALLAADLIQKHPDLTNHMILWSPVSNGKKFISQFMRIKLAAGTTRQTSGQQLTVKDLWAKLDNGENLEIAGYSLSPDLAKDLSTLSLNEMDLPQRLTISWIETSLNDPAKLSPASHKIIEQWKESGITVTRKAVNDIAFWTLQEPEWANKYIDQTTAFLTE
ncbi:MAG TPA: hydrolase 2, exosortase A system-associated [Sphingomonadales bacterium]|nr:hydrolase 2, exosortase A system-associated [Sphingomonadales bacterium]